MENKLFYPFYKKVKNYRGKRRKVRIGRRVIYMLNTSFTILNTDWIMKLRRSNGKEDN